MSETAMSKTAMSKTAQAESIQPAPVQAKSAIGSLIVQETAEGATQVTAARAFRSGEAIGELNGRQRTLAAHAIAILRRRVRFEDTVKISGNTVVDLEGPTVWMRHSGSPNARVGPGNDLVALRDIEIGQEVILDRVGRASPMTGVCEINRWFVARVKALGQRLLAALVRKPLEAPIADHSIFIERGRTGVLLIHGLGGTPVEMGALAEAFAEQGYTVHCPQLAGHCGTYHDLKQPHWQDWQQSVEEGLTRLGRSTDRIIVAGLSAGAILALNAASLHPEKVHGVILYAPTLWLNGWMVPPHAYLFNIVLQKPTANLFDFPDLPPHGIKDPAIRARIVAALNSGDASKAGVPVTPGGAVFEHRKLVRNVMARLNRIGQPVLIVHPREDDYADLNNISYLHRHLPGLVEIVSLNDSYHIVTVDRQRHIAIARSLEFMGRIAAVAGAETLGPPSPASARQAPAPPVGR